MDRKEVIEKISKELANNKQTISVKEDKNTSLLLAKQASEFSALANKASLIIKQAGEEISFYKNEIVKLSAEKKEAELALMENVKKEKAIKLANTMCEKGMISSFDIEKKAEEIICMNSDAYEVLRDTIENLPTSKIDKEASEDCSDSLSLSGSLYNGVSDKEDTKESMEEAISSMARRI